MTKRHKPTDRMRGLTEGMTLAGISQEKIAQLLELDAKTLRKHYRRELDCAGAFRLGDVALNIFKIASTGTGAAAVTAAKFILTMQGGWNGYQPIEAMEEMDLSRHAMMKMTDDELYCIARGEPLPRAWEKRILTEQRQSRRKKSH